MISKIAYPKQTDSTLNVVLVLAACVIMAALTVSFFQNRISDSNARSQALNQARAMTEIIARQTAGALRFQDSATLEVILSELTNLAEGGAEAGIAIGEDGIPLAGIARGLLEDEGLSALAAQSLQSGTIQIDAAQMRVAVPVFMRDSSDAAGAIALKWPTDQIDFTIIPTLTKAAIPLAILIVLGSFGMTRLMSKPMEKLKDELQTLASTLPTASRKLNSDGREDSFVLIRQIADHIAMLKARDTTNGVKPEVKEVEEIPPCASLAINPAVLTELSKALDRFKNGDLAAQIEQIGDLSSPGIFDYFNDMVEVLAANIAKTQRSAHNINHEALGISTTADALSRRTETTAATLEQTAAALDELTTSVRSAAAGAARADQVVSEARAHAEESGKIVIETVAAMDNISHSTGKITSIVKVIDDIAFQTNLLALNAGVEAARAGDAGRGFAVVASEVRALAQRSSDAAREINELIATSVSEVERGVEMVGQTGETLRRIVHSVSNISNLVSEIAVSAKEQAAGLADINSSVNDLDQTTQQNAARLEEMTAASEALTNDAMSLVESISFFKLSPDLIQKGSSFQPVIDKEIRIERAISGSNNTSESTFPKQSRPEANGTTGWEAF